MKSGGNMVISFKDTFSLFGISIVACCAVFVCTLFQNYQIDLLAMESEITGEVALTLFNAQVSMGKVTTAVTGGCLIATSIVMLFFYIKNYIDSHHKDLGILKAMGYSNGKIAIHFWVFGISILFGCLLGFLLAFLYLPRFYSLQNEAGYFPEFSPQFHVILPICLVLLPTILFIVLAIVYALIKLRSPVMVLLKEKRSERKPKKEDHSDTSFLKSLSTMTLKTKKVLAFFVAFSAFCFSAMVQMAMSMNELSSESFAWMILLIGLILAFMTLLLSLSSVVKGNQKTIAMMKVFGYSNQVCSQRILGVYRPISYVGFIIGTLYQYGLLKIVMTFVFADVENIPTYHFQWKAFFITLLAFLVTYECVMYLYSLRVRKCSIKEVMLDS